MSILYDKDQIVLLFSPKGEGTSEHKKFPVDTLFQQIAIHARSHASDFRPPQPLPTDSPANHYSKKSMPSQLLLFLRDQFKFDDDRASAEHGTFFIAPKFLCFVGQDWIALRVNGTYTSPVLKTLGITDSLATTPYLRRPHFHLWRFATYTEDSIALAHLDSNLVKIDEDGNITRAGAVFKPFLWPWPHVGWSWTGEMEAFGHISSLLQQSKDNPLTNIMTNESPYRGYGYQIANQLEAARAALDRPIV